MRMNVAPAHDGEEGQYLGKGYIGRQAPGLGFPSPEREGAGRACEGEYRLRVSQASLAEGGFLS